MKKFGKIIIINVGILVILLGVMEVMVRDQSSGWQNYITKEGGNLVEHHYKGLYEYDPLLGWVPRSNVEDKRWGFTIHTLDDGIRSNGNIQMDNARGNIVVVGDSYAFGDEMQDDKTWPAQLEKLSNYHVINGGVSSFGIDQMVIRAEELTKKYQADYLIFSFHYDNFRRIKQKVRHGVSKPYFLESNNTLVIKNSPVPIQKNTKLDIFRSVFGYSFLMHRFMSTLYPEYWWQGTTNDIQWVKSKAKNVVPLLFERLAVNIDDDIPIIICVLSGYEDTRIQLDFTVPILDFITSLPRKNIEILNLMPFYVKQKSDNKVNFSSLFNEKYGNRHPSVKGHMFIAQQIAQILK